MSIPSSLPFWGAADLADLGSLAAVDALERALLDGLDPAADPARIGLPLHAGELLLMPSQSSRWAGIKVITVAPGNAALGRPRIQGISLLFDAATLTPVAVIDGAAVTALRTPAVTMLALRPLLADRERLRVVVIGGGPQAVAHAEAVTAVVGERLDDLAIAARTPEKLAGTPLPRPSARVVGFDRLPALTADADVVICATTGRTPIFDSAVIAPGTVVAAVGSHEPDARELDSALLARAHVIVEDRAAALREAGDVVIPVREGVVDPDGIVELADLIRMPHPAPRDRPTVVKTVGMAWQDLVVTAALADLRG